MASVPAAPPVSRPRTVFAATGPFAVPALRALHRVTELTLVITRPPRPAGKERRLKLSPVAQVAPELGCRTVSPERIEELNGELLALQPDVLIVADYGQIIPESTLAIPKHGALNLHPSLLPRHRGPAPIQAAILSGEPETGVTIIKMDSKMDHGPIVAQERYPLIGHEITTELEPQLADACARLLAATLPRYLTGEIIPQEQRHEAASYHKPLKRGDGEVEWNETTAALERRFRALHPWPGLWFTGLIRGQKKIVKLLEVSTWTGVATPIAAGALFWDHGQLGIRTIDGALYVHALQVAGGRPVSGEAFYRGYQDVVAKVPMAPEEELLDVVDEHNTVIGQATREAARARGATLRNVAVFIRNRDGQFLIAKRSPHRKSYPNRWDTAAVGMVRAGESYEAAARRELQEELNLTCELKKLCVVYGEFTENSRALRYFTGCFVGTTDAPPILNSELSGYRFIDLTNLQKEMYDQPDTFSPGFIHDIDELADVLANA